MKNETRAGGTLPQCIFLPDLLFSKEKIAMETSDAAQLRLEIAFRGRMIEALLASNEELRGKCAHLSSFIQSKMELYSTSDKATIANLLVYSTTQKEMTLNEQLYSTPDLDVALNDPKYSTPDLGVTPNQSFYSTPQGRVALNHAIQHNTNKGNGINEVPQPLPKKFEQKSKVVYLFSSLLRQALQYKGRESAMEAAAFLMLHIYNDGDGDYPALCEATGQSQGGLAKMLMRLRKKGLIERTAFQKFALTETALNILRQAWEKLPK